VTRGWPNPRAHGAGRKKGKPNLHTAWGKQMLEQIVFEIGGVPQIVKWIRQDPDRLFRLLGRAYPQKVSLEGDGLRPIIQVITGVPHPEPPAAVVEPEPTRALPPYEP
jgi:hypothetical protein